MSANESEKEIEDMGGPMLECKNCKHDMVVVTLDEGGMYTFWCAHCGTTDVKGAMRLEPLQPKNYLTPATKPFTDSQFEDIGTSYGNSMMQLFGPADQDMDDLLHTVLAFDGFVGMGGKIDKDGSDEACGVFYPDGVAKKHNDFYDFEIVGIDMPTAEKILESWTTQFMGMTIASMEDDSNDLMEDFVKAHNPEWCKAHLKWFQDEIAKAGGKWQLTPKAVKSRAAEDKRAKKANEASPWALGELRELGIKTRGLSVKEARRKAVERINWISHNQVCPSSGRIAHYFRRWAKVLCYNAFMRGRLGLPTNAYLTREQGGLGVWKK